MGRLTVSYQGRVLQAACSFVVEIVHLVMNSYLGKYIHSDQQIWTAGINEKKHY